MTYPLAERQGAAQGNFFLVRLRVEDADGLTQLIRECAPIAPGEVPGAGARWGDAVVLLEGPFDIGLAYRAQRSGDRRWAGAWSGTQAMPEQVRLTLADRRTGRLRIPMLVQSLPIDAEVECAADPASCDVQSPAGGVP
jgi:hypothetical protein